MKKEGKVKQVSLILCDCGGTLRDNIDFDKARISLQSAHAGLLSIAMASCFCNAKKCARTAAKALKSKPEGIVIAACGREKYISQLSDVLKKEKFNEGLTASVNIREQCAWVHPNIAQATEKAVGLITAAVARVRKQESISSCVRNMCPDVVVLGGGMGGIRAALKLAELGRRVTLVHRAPRLGGTAETMAPFFGYLDNESGRGSGAMKEALNKAIAGVLNSGNITILSDSEVRAIEGPSGDFKVGVDSGGKTTNLKAGAIVLAVGSFSAFPFKAAGIKPSGRVTDLMGLASMLAQRRHVPQKIVIIMDVCGEQTRAVNALVFGAAELLAGRMKKEVKIYCRHARVAMTGLEALYRRARSAGAVVLRSDKSPLISSVENGVLVRGGNEAAGQDEQFDLAVFADSVPDEAVAEIARKAGIAGGPEGWLQHDNIWLLPVLTTRPGIFVVGASRGNNDFREAINDASGAAAAIDDFLGSGKIVVSGDQARVDKDKCVLCLTCVRSCPHSAPAVAVSGDGESKTEIEIFESACRRCGICAALCPAQAIQLPRWTDPQTEAEIERAGHVVVFACENSAWRAAAAAGTLRRQYGAGTRIIPVPCAGKADSWILLRALENGASKVILLGCPRESCRYLAGSDYAVRRIERLRAKIEQAGYKGGQVTFGSLTEFESEKFLDLVK